MRAFLAGSTGAIGKFLVPLLIENGHEVIALVRSAEKAPALETIGAKTALADPLNQKELTAAIVESEPEVIIHQLTALAGVGTRSTRTRRPASAKVWRRSGISKIPSGRPLVRKRSRFATALSTGRVPLLGEKL